MLFNLAETLHSSAKFKNKQVAKTTTKKDLVQQCNYFPEDWENTPFKKIHIFEVLKWA